MRVKTIFLDIGCVLVGLNYEIPLKAISNLNGLSKEQILSRLDPHSVLMDYERGQLTTQEFFNQISDLLEMNISFETFQQIWGSVFFFDGEDSDGLFSSGLFRLLKQNHRLIALSNTNEMQFHHLSKAYPLMREFDDYVLSYRIGSLKPDPQIYRVALQKAGCSPSETLFVDDQPENILAAEQMGIRGVLFTGEAKLRQELEKLGMLTADS